MEELSLAQLVQRILKLEPQYRERVWGGRRLRAADPPIGEAWVAFGPSRVSEGPLAGRSVDELLAEHGAELVGTAGVERFDGRFPLLIKLLDCSDWLSVQVHPDDEQARRLVGPGEFGKTEAWYFLDVEPGAAILAGVKPGVSREALADSIREGRIVDVAQRVEVEAGEALLIPAGTLHALGPGLLLYEIQQASDTTYRAYDWDRPTSAGRRLHIEESVEVATAKPARALTRPEVVGPTGAARAVSCDYFDLDLVRVSAETALVADTAARTFHIVTAVAGGGELRSGDETARLGRFETALVAATAGHYTTIAIDGTATLLRAAIPS
jgi:mannose-6-phosphate isomerase